MTLKDLRRLEEAYFTSEKANLREYAKAYKEIYTNLYYQLWII